MQTATLPERARDILRDKVFVHLALTDEQGRPHVTPLWVDVDDEGLIIINTAEGRVKARLLQEGAPVALSALDPETPYRYISVRGTVVERTHEGALEQIDALARKYQDKPWKARDGEQRVTVKIRADEVIGVG